MSSKIKIWISGVSKDITPGGIIRGTVNIEVTTTELVLLKELIVKLHGHGISKIFRELNLPFFLFQLRWDGEAIYCERLLILIDQPTTLATGQTHQFPFSLKVPETADIVLPDTKREKRRKDWGENVPPFCGLKWPVANPLPPTMAAKFEYSRPFSWGKAKGEIEYELRVQGKIESQHLTILPFSTQKLVMGAPMVGTRPGEEIELVNLSQSLTGKHNSVKACVQIPAIITQREVLSVQFKLDTAGFSLISLKAKLYTAYAVRGRRSFFATENVNSVEAEEKLLVWEGKTDLTPGHFQLFKSQQPIASTAAVGKFATLNIACIAHGLEVKFKVQDSQGKIFSGIFDNFPVEIRGPALNETAAGEESPRASISASEYKQWVEERS